LPHRTEIVCQATIEGTNEWVTLKKKKPWDAKHKKSFGRKQNFQARTCNAVT
jgi:hypothetical protein